jgi:hypothetical protein
VAENATDSVWLPAELAVVTKLTAPDPFRDPVVTVVPSILTVNVSPENPLVIVAVNPTFAVTVPGTDMLSLVL